MELITQRLLLRSMTPEDAQAVYDYSKNPNVGNNAGWKPHENLEETVGLMREVFLNQPTVWGIVEKATGKLIGSVGLIDDPKRQNPNARMLGYALAEECWGKGYMTEAALAAIEYSFDEYDISLVSAYSYPENARSKRVLEKCGFEHEGRLKDAELLYDGSLRDNDCWLLMRARFDALLRQG